MRLEELARIVITNSLQCQSSGTSFNLRTKEIIVVLSTEEVTNVNGMPKLKVGKNLQHSNRHS